LQRSCDSYVFKRAGLAGNCPVFGLEKYITVSVFHIYSLYAQVMHQRVRSQQNFSSHQLYFIAQLPVSVRLVGAASWIIAAGFSMRFYAAVVITII
jgi:hypothetical protein